MTPQNRAQAPAEPRARGNTTQHPASPARPTGEDHSGTQGEPTALLWEHPDTGLACLRNRRTLTSVIFTHWLRTGSYLTTARRHNTTTSHVIAAVHYELGKKQRNQPRAYQQAMQPD